MKVSATLKGVKDSLGRRTVYIRINDGYSRKFFATQMKVKPSDFKKGRVLPSDPNAQLYNNNIRKRILEAESGILNPVGTDRLLKEYLTACLNEWDKTKAWGTLKQLKTEGDKVDSYHPNLRLSQITPDWLVKYQTYLFSKGNTTNTVWKSFKFLKLIVRKAHLEKLIKDNPFDIYKSVKYKDPVKTYLTKEQVQKIEDYCKTAPQEEIRFAGTWFVIACYTGLRFGDLNAFSKSKIKGGRLVIYTAKTGEIVSIKVSEKLKELLERVGYKPLGMTNQNYNRTLKAVGTLAGIDTPLTSHLSRHSFATMLASAGVGIEVTSKLLGHSSIKTTSVYYRLTSDRLDEEMNKLF